MNTNVTDFLRLSESLPLSSFFFFFKTSLSRFACLHAGPFGELNREVYRITGNLSVCY